MKTYIIVLIAGIGLGAGLVYQFYPRTVVKTVETTKDHIVVQTHVVKQPDGTVVTDSTRTTDVIKTDDRTSVTAPKVPVWAVQGMYGTNKVWGAGISRRIIGPAWVGLEGTSRGDALLSLRIEF